MSSKLIEIRISLQEMFLLYRRYTLALLDVGGQTRSWYIARIGLIHSIQLTAIPACSLSLSPFIVVVTKRRCADGLFSGRRNRYKNVGFPAFHFSLASQLVLFTQVVGLCLFGLFHVFTTAGMN